MEKIVYSIGFNGEPGEYPELPERFTHEDVVNHEIENLSRCCMQLRRDVADLQAEVERLRKICGHGGCEDGAD